MPSATRGLGRVNTSSRCSRHHSSRAREALRSLQQLIISAPRRLIPDHRDCRRGCAAASKQRIAPRRRLFAAFHVDFRWMVHPLGVPACPITSSRRWNGVAIVLMSAPRQTAALLLDLCWRNISIPGSRCKPLQRRCPLEVAARLLSSRSRHRTAGHRHLRLYFRESRAPRQLVTGALSMPRRHLAPSAIERKDAARPRSRGLRHHDSFPAFRNRAAAAAPDHTRDRCLPTAAATFAIALALPRRPIIARTSRHAPAMPPATSS